MECVDVVIARQRHAEHVSVSLDTHATIEELLEALFSVQCVLRLYRVRQARYLFHKAIAI
jgi:hypothetical protein